MLDRMIGEATITINGKLLTPGEAMTVRVAIESLAVDLDVGLGDDEHGKAMVAGYRAAISGIRKAIRER